MACIDFSFAIHDCSQLWTGLISQTVNRCQELLILHDIKLYRSSFHVFLFDFLELLKVFLVLLEKAKPSSERNKRAEDKRVSK